VAQDPFAIPATDDGLPGKGPIRRYDWFQKLWRERRAQWAKERAGQGRRRLSRRLDHAGLGRRPRRGISRREGREPRHQRRHHAGRADPAQDDVLALDRRPSCC
jgi:hypothetical protein